MATAPAPVEALTITRATRVLLLLATVLFPLSALAALFFASGIAMTTLDADDSSSLLDNLWLVVLAGIMLINFLALGVAWTLHGLGRFRVGFLLSALISGTISALVLLNLATALATD